VVLKTVKMPAQAVQMLLQQLYNFSLHQFTPPPQPSFSWSTH
jgi:hypothetical protein